VKILFLLKIDDDIEYAIENDEMYILYPKGRVWGHEYQKEYPNTRKLSSKSFSSENAMKLSLQEIIALIKTI